MVFIPSHCSAAKPTKNLSQNAGSLIKIVAVKLMSLGTPNTIRSEERAISGSSTSNGTPTGMDFMATEIAEVTSIALQLTLAFGVAKKAARGQFTQISKGFQSDQSSAQGNALDNRLAILK